jgi:hypothetical protein
MAAESRVQLAIAPAAATYEAGQPIRVRVAVLALQDSSIRQARADLVQKIWTDVDEGDPRPQRTVTGAGTALALPGSLLAGARADFEAVLPNWAKAPTGGPSLVRRIEYSVRAELVLADGSKVRREAPVRLVSGSSLYQAVEGTVRAHKSRRCEIELVPPLRARPGEALRGAFRVVPRRPMRARSVRLSLWPRQSFPGSTPRRGRTVYSFIQHQTLARDVVLTVPSEFPFELELSGDMCPTLITPYLWVRWYLRASVAYGVVVSPDRLECELNVYNRPP